MKKITYAKIMGVLMAVLVLALMPALVSSAAPAPVNKLRLICRGNKSAFLGWNDVKNADAYSIYRCESDGSYTLIARSKTSDYHVKHLKPGKKYRFVVRTVKGGVESENSNIVTVTGKKINVNDVHGRYWVAKMKTTMTVKDLKTGKKIKLKKGTALFTTACTNIKITGILKNGHKIKIKGNKLKYSNLWVTKSWKYYSKEQAEAFVNSKGYKSDTNWLIWVSQYTSSVHIFQGSRGKWVRKRIAPCVIGTLGHTTPGEFKLIRRDPSHGKPGVLFSWNPEKNWGHAFHCRIDSHTTGPYSNGCVRLGDSDLVYLVNKCPLGTKVVSY